MSASPGKNGESPRRAGVSSGGAGARWEEESWSLLKIWGRARPAPLLLPLSPQEPSSACSGYICQWTVTQIAGAHGVLPTMIFPSLSGGEREGIWVKIVLPFFFFFLGFIISTSHSSIVSFLDCSSFLTPSGGEEGPRKRKKKKWVL